MIYFYFIIFKVRSPYQKLSEEKKNSQLFFTSKIFYVLLRRKRYQKTKKDQSAKDGASDK